MTLRHYIKIASDDYFSNRLNAKNIDLFMLTSSVSSPIGPGSDSEPIKIKLGKLETNLVDSSQFGFEPLLLNNFNRVYCYLPSMRGEDCDARHINQFFHCEMEMVGTLEDLIPLIEGYVKNLCFTVLLMENIVDKISKDPKATKKALADTTRIDSFPMITFDEAINLLIRHHKKNLVNFTNHGRDISSKGEIELMQILKVKTPVWVMHYDRDRVLLAKIPKK